VTSKKLIDKIRKYQKEYETYTQEQLISLTNELKKKALSGMSLNKLLPQAFGMVATAAYRKLGMNPFDVQLIGGIALHNGKIAEMKTGEGKTLVATCPVFLNALTGRGVHVITVNDYLAKRDSTQMGEVYSYLGLSCGCIYSGMDFYERKAAYQCDITYGTNSEFGFDYLRDNLAKVPEQTVQRGLNYAIIDEVDSVLIDDSKTPLIISGKSKNNPEILTLVDSVVKSLNRTTNYNPNSTITEKLEQQEYNGDYILIEKTKEVILTDSGIEKIEKILKHNLSDTSNIISHYITQSLKANYVMHKDVDYVVKDGKIMIIDGSTGRIMDSRKYSDGLHQAIEAKEGVNITEENVTQGTVTYQNFFRMYNKICGMTGTAYTDKYEFKEIYGLKVQRIPTNKPVIRIDAPDMLFSTKEQKYKAILEKVKELHAKGQPILIGTPSVEESEKVALFIKKAGFSFNVLNAKNHEEEAKIIAQAGSFNAITIATNMAGRGTDILLGGNPSIEFKQINSSLEAGEIRQEEYNVALSAIRDEYKKEHEKVVACGGLAVLGVERFDNRRIDDQLRGRSGRQGDPGYSQFFLSMEDKMLRIFGGITKSDTDFSYTTKLNEKIIRNAQKQMENMSFAARKNTLEYDDVNDVQRKQIYKIRNEIMHIDSKGLMDIFYNYRDMVCKKIIKSNSNLNVIFRTDEKISNTIDGICAYMDLVMERNKHELESQNGSIEQMIRYIMLSTIDMLWVNYINETITLKETVGITTMGTLKPLQLYKMQSIQMFNHLIWNIKEKIVIDAANIRIKAKPQPQQAFKVKINL